MKLYVLLVAGLQIIQSTCLADTENYEFSAPPLYTHINRKPEKDLEYGLCLARIKNSIQGEADRLGIFSPLGEKSCPDEKAVNGRSAAQREEDSKSTRMYEPVAIAGNPEAQAQMKYQGLTRTWKYTKVVGFFRLVKKNPEDKGQWDSFCLAQINTVDSGEEEETLLVCDKEKVTPPPGEKAKFTCPEIGKCVGEKEQHQVVQPTQIGSVAGDASKNIKLEGQTDGNDSGGASGRTHKSDQQPK